MSKASASSPMLADLLGGRDNIFAMHAPYEGVLACPTCELPLRATLDTCPNQRTWHGIVIHDDVDGHDAHAPLDAMQRFVVTERVRDAWIGATFVALSRHERARAPDEGVATSKPSREELARRRREKREAAARRRAAHAPTRVPPSDAPDPDA